MRLFLLAWIFCPFLWANSTVRPALVYREGQSAPAFGQIVEQVVGGLPPRLQYTVHFANEGSAIRIPVKDAAYTPGLALLFQDEKVESSFSIPGPGGALINRANEAPVKDFEVYLTGEEGTYEIQSIRIKVPTEKRIHPDAMFGGKLVVVYREVNVRDFRAGWNTALVTEYLKEREHGHLAPGRNLFFFIEGRRVLRLEPMQDNTIFHRLNVWLEGEQDPRKVYPNDLQLDAERSHWPGLKLDLRPPSVWNRCIRYLLTWREPAQSGLPATSP